MHNALYDQACALIEGSVWLDGRSFRKPGFLARRKLRKAILLFQRVIALNEQNWSATFLIGKCHQSLGNDRQALECFLRAHDGDPDHSSMAKEAGGMAGQMGDHETAIRVMRKAVENDHDNAGLLVNFGLSCLMSDNATEAITAFERAHKLEPEATINKSLLELAREVAAGKRPCPTTENEIREAM